MQCICKHLLHSRRTMKVISESEACLSEDFEVSSRVRLGCQIVQILRNRMSPILSGSVAWKNAITKSRNGHTIATRARRRVDQIDRESYLLASSSPSLVCIDNAARTILSVTQSHNVLHIRPGSVRLGGTWRAGNDSQCSAASLCTPMLRPIPIFS
jgi:hypothetical protein